MGQVFKTPEHHTKFHKTQSPAALQIKRKKTRYHLIIMKTFISLLKAAAGILLLGVSVSGRYPGSRPRCTPRQSFNVGDKVKLLRDSLPREEFTITRIYVKDKKIRYVVESAKFVERR